MKSFFAVLSLILIGGCIPQGYPSHVPPSQAQAQYQPSRTIFNFPDRTALTEIARTPAPTHFDQVDAQATDVESWDLSTPFPEQIGETPYEEDTSPLGQALTEVLTSNEVDVALSESMRCVARQVGLFFLEHNDLPGEDLTNFMAQRCGATSDGVKTLAVHSRHHRSTPNARVFPDMRRSASRMLGERLPQGRSTMGYWQGRARGHAVVVMMIGTVLAELDPISPLSPTAQHVWIAGELTFPAERIEGLINQGDASVVFCEPSQVVRPPRFALRCPVAADDETALLQLGAVESGRVLLRNVASIMIRREGDVALSWRQPTWSTESPVSSTEDFAMSVLSGVNSIRAASGRAPLELAREQSQTASGLAPHFFAQSSSATPGGQRDLIAMGLAAGWDVQHIIRRSWFSAARVSNTGDANQWLAYALSQPAGRNALLNPNARVLAVGGIVDPEHESLAAIISTYALFDDQDARQQAQEIQQRILNARRFRGLPSNVMSSRAAAEEALRVRNEGAIPQAALDRAIQRATLEWQRPVQGMVFEFFDASQFQVPEALLLPGSGLLAVEITHHRPVGGAWGQYVGFLLVAM